jgi:hypothetical protein
MMNNARTFLAALILAVPMGNPMLAQNKKDKADAKTKTEARPTAPQELLITVTTMHRNLDKNAGSRAEWLALEKEYFDKVTAKNELVLGSNVLTHYFTPDNSEILLVSAYANWNDIEKSADRADELIKAAWPDEASRDTFFKKRAKYYSASHSDEIYQEVPGSKSMTAKSTKPMIYYVRKSHFSYPDDGNEKDFTALFNQYLTAVTNKNDYIKAYYPHVHAWGANKTEFTEVFVVDQLGDIEKMFDRDDELFEAAWPGDAKQKEFNDALDKYFDGTHADYIYQSVPELIK